MRWLTLALALIVLLAGSLAGCAPTQLRFARASEAMRDRRFVEARDRYAALAERGDPRQRVRAGLGAAHASAALGDRPGERRWLERAAAEPAVEGLSEEAWFELAVVLDRAGDRTRCLAFYYRAAAAAERSGRRDLYDRSIHAISRLGMVSR